MKSFRQYLKEKRSHPELNPKISVYDQLKSYFNKPDVFISFTQVEKLGINPRSNYNTPLGIYSYPIKEISKYFDHKEKKVIVPFAGDMPWINVFSGKGRILEVSKYNSKDYDRDMVRLRMLYNREFKVDKKEVQKYEKRIHELETEPHVSLIMSPEEYANSKSTQSMVAHQIAAYKKDLHSAKNPIDGIIRKGIETARNIGPVWAFWNTVRLLAYKDEASADHYSKKGTRKWNDIMRSLGYDGVSDRTGMGVIHPAEPIQAVFFSIKPITMIDRIRNGSIKDVAIENKSDLFKAMYNDKVSFNSFNYELETSDEDLTINQSLMDDNNFLGKDFGALWQKKYPDPTKMPTFMMYNLQAILEFEAEYKNKNQYSFTQEYIDKFFEKKQ